MRRLPIRLRLTAAFGVAMAMLLAGAGAFLYVQLGRSLTRSLDQSLRARADVVAALVSQSESGLREAPATTRAGAPVAQVLDRKGGVIDATRGAGGEPLLSPRQVRQALRRPLLASDGEARLYAMPVDAQDRRFVVVTATSLEPRAEALSGLLTELLVGGPVALALASLLGFGLATAALRPIEAMRARAGGISASDRGARLPVPAGRDEVTRLAETLNGLLERLEQAIERERRFVANASHELRTPLALLEAEIELALDGTQTPALLRGALVSAREEVDRLTRLAEDLLQLARLDGGRLPVRLERVDLQDVAASVARRFAPRARGAGRRVVAAPADSVAVAADRLRIEQAAVNLVDNALRHGAGAVEIGAVRRADRAELRVRDHGTGVGASAPAGLGLTIVAAIAASHGGALRVENAPEGGLVATLDLPIASDATGAG